MFLKLLTGFIFLFVFVGFSQIVSFETLDQSNALNKDYHNFKWSTWKLAIAFAHPDVTGDSLYVQERIFKDICPSKTFYNFLIEEITRTFTLKSQFLAIEWYPIPLKKDMKSFDYKNNLYYLAIPDSSLNVFRNTGCRFILLLQKFSPNLTLSDMSIIYQKAAPTAIENKNYSHSRMHFSFSFTYVLYDLLENQIVQFGNAFDDNRSKNVTVDEIKRSLNAALIDVLEVSKFYYK